jgi:hypothetical protein
MSSMTYIVTADTRSGQETKRTETPTMALAWARDFRQRGAAKVTTRDEKRAYSERDLEGVINAKKTQGG